MPHSSAVNGEEDNLTDSTGGSAGSGIGLLLASAAGKDGSLSGSGSGSASQDPPKELESSAKAARCRVASVDILIVLTRYCSQSNTSYIRTYIHTWSFRNLISMQSDSTSRSGGILKRTASSSSWLFRSSSVDDDSKSSSASRARLADTAVLFR